MSSVLRNGGFLGLAVVVLVRPPLEFTVASIAGGLAAAMSIMLADEGVTLFQMLPNRRALGRLPGVRSAPSGSGRA